MRTLILESKLYDVSILFVFKDYPVSNHNLFFNTSDPNIYLNILYCSMSNLNSFVLTVYKSVFAPSQTDFTSPLSKSKETIFRTLGWAWAGRL